MMKKLLIFLIFSTTIKYVSACSCTGKSTVIDGLKYSDVVFSGVIISNNVTLNYDSLSVESTDSTSWENIVNKYPIRVVKIKIDLIFKGNKTLDTITILTPPDGAGCGNNFELGKKYIIYATKTDEVNSSNDWSRRVNINSTFWTNLCTRTGDWYLKEEKEIIKVISKE